MKGGLDDLLGDPIKRLIPLGSQLLCGLNGPVQNIALSDFNPFGISMLGRLTCNLFGLGIVLLAKPVPFQGAIAQVPALNIGLTQRVENKPATAKDKVTQLFRGITHIHRTDTVPRRLSMHIVKIDLSDPDIRFELTSDNGPKPGDTQMETTLSYVQRIGGQVGINIGFFGDKIFPRETEAYRYCVSGRC